MGNSKTLIVIGGGPAGMLAAGTAAQKGVHTILLEKMEQPGRKLRITGKGRCNLTNQKDVREFISHFGQNGVFLYRAFSRFFVSDLLELMHRIGIDTITERGGRIFPSNVDAKQLTERLIGWVKQQGVDVRIKSSVQEILVENDQIKAVRLQDGEVFACDAVILAVGGASYTGTGSTGDGYLIAQQLGHSIEPIRPALVPLKTAGDTAKRLQGLALRNVRANILVEEKKKWDEFGELLFTHFGVSGPIILTLSGRIVDVLREGKKVDLSIDLKPALDEKKLDQRLMRELNENGKKQFSTILKNLLPQKMIPICCKQVRIPAEKECSQVNSAERKALLRWLKDFRFTITDSLPIEAAIVTAGGIELSEIESRTMESKVIKNLYFAGEILDLNADTGGYNLQAAFSTGWLAGDSAARNLEFS